MNDKKLKLKPGHSTDWYPFLADLAKLEQRAADMGLWVTMRALNAATRAAGYERAGDVTTAIKRAIDRINPEGDP